MQKVYQELEKKMSLALNKCGYNLEVVEVLESNRPDLSEYQFNGAMSMAKKYHKSPLEIANEVVNVLKDDPYFKDVFVAGPGFINMTLSDNALINFINKIDFTYPKKDELIFFDYGGANVAKSLHVGHLRSANIGEALKRLCNYLGYKTISDTHLGDWGRPLGLVILELKKRNPDWLFFDESYKGEYEIPKITNELLEEIYPYASTKAKEDSEYLKEAQEMTRKLQMRERGIIALWDIIMSVSKRDIRKIYDRLNTSFDLYKGESDAEKYVPTLIKYVSKLGIVTESEGAKVIEIKKDDDKKEMPPMLLVKSDGGILYSTTELATIYDRMENYKPNEIWYIADKRQSLHFEQVFRAAYKANMCPNTKLIFAGFGTMNSSDGKPFKTRDGGVMRLTDLLDQVKSECLKRLNENIEEDRENIAETIAIATIKFADLFPNRETDYNFDLEKFCDLDGTTGPYILYSTIRMSSLLKNADVQNIKYKSLKKIKGKYDRDLIINLTNLDKVLKSSFNSKSLNDITEYLYRLTNSYNRFYTEYPILKESDLELRESWLYLTSIILKVNQILLDILAIKIPKVM